MIARRPISLKAICMALCDAQVAIGTQTRTRSGKSTAQASACIPPIEPPMTANNFREMPKMFDATPPAPSPCRGW